MCDHSYKPSKSGLSSINGLLLALPHFKKEEPSTSIQLLEPDLHSGKADEYLGYPHPEIEQV